jgi:hypothetical protein
VFPEVHSNDVVIAKMSGDPQRTRGRKYHRSFSNTFHGPRGDATLMTQKSMAYDRSSVCQGAEGSQANGTVRGSLKLAASPVLEPAETIHRGQVL